MNSKFLIRDFFLLSFFVFTLRASANEEKNNTNKIETDNCSLSPSRKSTHVYFVEKGVDPNLLSLDLYGFDEKLSGATKKSCPLYPVLIYVHGGGWQNGDKKNAMRMKPDLFNSQGFIFISVNYRLSPKVMHPVQVQDLARAVDWVLKNISRWGGDPEKISLMGHSAGAHLVSLLATHPSHLKKIANINGGQLRCVVSNDTAVYNIPDVVSSRADSHEVQNIFVSIGRDSQVLRDASPSLQIKKSSKLPQFLVITRGSARRRRTASEFVDVLKGVGAQVQTLTLSDLSHSQVNTLIGSPNDLRVTPEVVKFLEKCKR